MTSYDLFVPGRLCLAGEHSDWAASYREVSAHATVGSALVVALNQGIQAQVSRSSDLSLYSPLASTLRVSREHLLNVAQSDSPWRYAVAVSYVIHRRFAVPEAVCIRVIQETLPPRKGLSSSAAICVLVARAYNIVYGLSFTEAGEMEIAYQGERLTGSACGRMDQIVAIGSGRAAHMTFDGEYVSHRVLPNPKAPIHIVVAQVGTKDTAEILRGLHKAYPNADTAEKIRLQKALGAENLSMIQTMNQAIGRGDAIMLGRLMTKAQAIFDNAAIPFCPEQLTAPNLHRILQDADVLPLVYGGKGVGSQGDGSVQFVAKSNDAAKVLLSILSNKLKTEPFIVTVGKLDSADIGTEPFAYPQRPLSKQIKLQTAVIPAAGFGTRLYPASKSIRPKALLPIIDSDGFAKPLLLHLVEQCAKAQIQRIAIVVSPGEQEDRVRDVFKPVSRDLYKALKPHMRQYADRIVNLGKLVQIDTQPNPRGFGHAVSCASVAQDEPFLLLLGDVAFDPGNSKKSCIQQILEAYDENPSRTVVGVTHVAICEAGAYGVVKTAGEIRTNGERTAIEKMIEKPDAEVAKSLSFNDVCNIILGPYAFTPKLMKLLHENVEANQSMDGEIQLTPTMTAVLEEEGMDAILLDGSAYDTGNPVDYRNTISRLGV
ncbi:GHMP kinase [Gracilaria domingensis]|nr:GHMP kinase [Gracilaria domingensis]